MKYFYTNWPDCITKLCNGLIESMLNAKLQMIILSKITDGIKVILQSNSAFNNQNEYRLLYSKCLWGKCKFLSSSLTTATTNWKSTNKRKQRRLWSLSSTNLPALFIPVFIFILITRAQIMIASKMEPIEDDGHSMQKWDEIFHLRSEDDWRQLWHREKHRRCQQELLVHMELVCQKDIYKIERRKKRFLPNFYSTDNEFDIDSDMDDDNLFEQELENPSDDYRFLNFKEANIFGHKHLKRLAANRENKKHREKIIHVKNGPKLKSKIEDNFKNQRELSGLIGVRIREKRGISDECCHGHDGCSWEEYAEYCPLNVRIRY